uniref:Protein Wnt n=1 Tax=Oncorhynchus kisutch TaxID=8019 RepID=A0A8C7F7Q9_ONCKI
MERRSGCGVHQMCFLFLLLFSLYPVYCRASWMWLGITSVGVPEKLGCANLPLTHKQKDLCKRKPHLLSSIKAGARIGIAECQTQFEHERWNCSTTKELSVFGYELTSGTKETAFIHAVMAAGLVQAVTRSCSAGNMTECGCDTSLQGTGSPSKGWHWGGCSDHIQYGTWFSRKFIDNAVKNMSSARGGDALLTMNQHNSEAGRQFFTTISVTLTGENVRHKQEYEAGVKWKQESNGSRSQMEAGVKWKQESNGSRSQMEAGVK